MPTAITSLAARLDDDISPLGDLKLVFNGVDGRNSHILASDDAYEHIQKVVNHIKPLLQETIRKVEKIDKGPKSIAARARWLVVGGDLEKAERDLFEWSQRLSVRLTLIPYQIKLIFDQKQADSPFSVLKAQTTMEMYQRFQSTPSLLGCSSHELPSSLLDNSCLTKKRNLTNLLDSQSPVVIFEPKLVAGWITESPKLMSWVKDELEKLTAVLQAASPSEMHVLRAHGFVSFPGKRSGPDFGILYQIPRGFETTYRFSSTQVSPESFDSRFPTTLHSLFMAKSTDGSRITPEHSLGQRFEFARQIATAVFYCHSIGWVHKSITSHNILMSWKEAPKGRKQFPQNLGSAFLTGFEYSRRAQDVTQHQTFPSWGLEDDYWKFKICQHPHRQIEHGEDLPPDDHYTYADDLYSLGVVLLEVARWRPLEASAQVLRFKSPEARRKELLAMSKRSTVVVGERYTRLLQRCLGNDGWVMNTSDLGRDHRHIWRARRTGGRCVLKRGLGRKGWLSKLGYQIWRP